MDRAELRVQLSQQHQICAGGIRGRDSCGGDSGGPLLIKSNNGNVNIFADA